MALDTPLSPSQMEFLAEDELITIIPNFKLPALYFIKGNISALHPSVPVTVPLWLALLLKKRRKCKIQQPDWLDPDYLTEVLKEEQSDKKLTDLPFHYMEIGTLLLDQALDDIRNPSKVRPLLEQIWNKRAVKIRDTLLTLKEEVFVFKFNSASGMEINKMRPVVSSTLSRHYLFKPETDTNT